MNQNQNSETINNSNTKQKVLQNEVNNSEKTEQIEKERKEEVEQNGVSSIEATQNDKSKKVDDGIIHNDNIETINNLNNMPQISRFLRLKTVK